jgi:hypothetical protein
VRKLSSMIPAAASFGFFERSRIARSVSMLIAPVASTTPSARCAAARQIAAALKGQGIRPREAVAKGHEPGVVRVTNAISTFLFQPSELQ